MPMEIQLDAYEVNEVLSYTRRVYGLETKRNGNDFQFFTLRNISRQLRNATHGDLVILECEDMTRIGEMADDAGLDKLVSDLMDCAV